MPQPIRDDLAAPALVKRRRLRILGTEITLLEQVRKRAEADLGFGIDFEVHDFLSCQRQAAMDAQSYDIYDQCFHNLDIVWFWGSLQPIDTRRISDWDRLSGLTREGGINKYAWRGHGDAPVRKLYVQPGEFLGPEPSRHISMLPTVHNLDSFGYDTRLFGRPAGQRESWAWLLDPRARGRIALVDEPAIGIFDVALAAEAAGELQFADIGNMTVAEVDALMAFLNDRRQQGYFRAVWRDAEEAGDLIRGEQVSVQSMWSPVYGGLRNMAGVFVEAAPIEGYRAWHGGLSLARHLTGAPLDMGYEYLNWWLSGWPGAVMARQGYYMSVLDRVREALPAAEWAYWYEGAAAAVDLPGPSGDVVVAAGARRSGGSYWARASQIAVWNTAMDEHNYAARAWDRFASRVRSEAP
ncbi:MAG: signal peptide prediction [Alphaproteobacteria bacterium]|nr:signal peptide prediction [Alphaproteobacteria bacterium]